MEVDEGRDWVFQNLFGVSQKPLVNHLGGYLRISLSPILFGALL